MKIYRKRFNPPELKWLKDDVVHFADENIIVTSWRTLNPRTDFTHGASCYFLRRNFKISKFYDARGLMYYYCDVFRLEICRQDPDGGEKYIFNDLLVDLIVHQDTLSHAKVLDLDELAAAYEAGHINSGDLLLALRVLDELLEIIYSNGFEALLDNFSYELP